MNGTVLPVLNAAYLEWQKENFHLIKELYTHGEPVTDNYVEEIFSGPGWRWTCDFYTNHDYKSNYVNVKDGLRVTTNTPLNPHSKIHIFGDSILYGIGVEDSRTMPSILQQRINAAGYSIAVMNHGVRSNCLINIFNQILHTDISQNDWVVVFMPPRLQSISKIALDDNIKKVEDLGWILAKQIDTHCKTQGAGITFCQWPNIDRILNPSEHEILMRRIRHDSVNEICVDVMNGQKNIIQDKLLAHDLPLMDMTELFHRPHAYGELFWDNFHIGYNGYKIISDKLFSLLEYKKTEKSIPERMLAKEISSFEMEKGKHIKAHDAAFKKDILQYLNTIPKFNSKADETTGAIVMNCNPFTNGHKHLIEYASAEVDWLYIFIVEENKSFFPFEERFYLVKKGIAHLKNVKVIPSGKFILSSLTFPEYFDKDKKPDCVNPTEDIKLFANYIAPYLKITKRFVGKEPFCEVTGEYNRKMKEILPAQGIDMVEIDRLTAEERPISATQVRKYISDKDSANLQKLLPPPQLRFRSQKIFLKCLKKYSLQGELNAFHSTCQKSDR